MRHLHHTTHYPRICEPPCAGIIIRTLPVDPAEGEWSSSSDQRYFNRDPVGNICTGIAKRLMYSIHSAHEAKAICWPFSRSLADLRAILGLAGLRLCASTPTFGMSKCENRAHCLVFKSTDIRWESIALGN